MPAKRGGSEQPPLTLRMRVRAKNPQIGRRPTDSESGTLLADPGVRDDTPPFDEDDATEVLTGPAHAEDKPRRMPSRRSEAPREGRPLPPFLASGAIAERTSEPTAVERARDPAESAIPPDRGPAARPRAPIGGRGTDALGALAKQLHVERMERELPAASTPGLKLLRSHLSQQQIDTLEAALSGQAERRDLESAAASPKRALERLIHAPEFHALATPDRAGLIGAIAVAPLDVESITAALRLVETGAIAGAAHDARARLLELLALLPSAERQNLAALGARTLHGRSALLDRDFQDVCAIDHLHAIATSRRLAPSSGGARLNPNNLLASMISILARPTDLPLEDGGDGVLGMFEFGLADVSPAEYAGLWRALVTGDMSASLPNEGTLDLKEALRSQPGLTFSGTNTPLRVGLEQLVALAHPRSGPRRAGFIMPGGNCIDADVVARALGHLYGVSFTVAAGASQALRTLENASRDLERVPPAFATIVHTGSERLFVFDHLDAEYVYVRVPHSRSSKPRGTRRGDPPREVEDPIRGVDRICRSDWMDHAGVALVPRT